MRETAKCLGAPFFEGRDKILLLEQAMKFGVIIQKFALKLLRNFENYEENAEEMQVFTKIFVLFSHVWGNIRIIIYWCPTAEPPNQKNVQ